MVGVALNVMAYHLDMQSIMQAMNQRYDSRLDTLRERLEKLKEDKPTSREIKSCIQEEITGLLNGEIESEVFYKHLLEQLTVFKDRHMELKLSHLPMVFHFA